MVDLRPLCETVLCVGISKFGNTNTFPVIAVTLIATANPQKEIGIIEGPTI